MPSAAQRVIRAGSRHASEIVDEIGDVGDRPVVVIIGGAGGLGDDTLELVTPVFERAIAPVLIAARAVVVTGGTASGVMALAGRTLRDHRTLLIGVSPRGARRKAHVALDRAHNVQVEAEGSTWGSESALMVELAGAIAGSGTPRLVILVNGGEAAVEEVNRFMDDQWPVLVLKGSEGAADDLVSYAGNPRASGFDWVAVDPLLVESFDVKKSSYQLSKILRWRMSPDQLLKQAWIKFLELDAAAKAKQRASRRMRLALGAGAFVFVGLVCSRIQYELLRGQSSDKSTWISDGSVVQTVAAPLLIALPLGLAVVAALSDSLAADRGWHTVRRNAEAVKREIYRYRAGAVDNRARVRAESKQRLKNMLDSAMAECADVDFVMGANPVLIAPRPTGLDFGDDETGPLAPSVYAATRLGDQLAYFKRRRDALRGRELRVIAVSALLAAAAGTLASTALSPWSAFLVLAASGFTAYLERSRLRLRALQYARAAAALSRVTTWWATVDSSTRAKTTTVQRLVTQTEDILQQENEGWSQIGSDSLATFRDPMTVL